MPLPRARIFPLRVAITTAIVIAIAGCTRGVPGPTGAGSSRGKRTVNLGIWAAYVAPGTLSDFERRTGIHARMSNYASNEELLAKMQAGGSTFDVVVPSDYMVFVMIKLGLLRPLDYAGIPNFRGIDPKFLGKSYDPKNRYSVPYDWGTTGIAINRALYGGKIRSWKDLFNRPDLAGKFTLLDDARETIGAALKSLGYSLNSKDPAQLNQARQVLLNVRKRVKGFTPDPILTLTDGDAAIAHNYSSNALQARKALGGKVEWVFPEEGGTLWIDNLVIPAAAPHPAEAEALVNFLLDPKVVAATVQAVFVSPTNREALKFLPQSLLNDRALFPTSRDLNHFEMIEDLGETVRDYDRIWTEVKASRD